MSYASITTRRAIAARLVVCLLPVGALMGGGIASAAAATPKVPKLIETSPTSSATATASSVTPKVLGEAEPKDEVITQVMPLGAGRWWSPAVVANPTKHPNFEIQIFFGANCPGAPIATGPASELEETGITVTVPANALTTLSALQVNTEEGGSSTCSPPLNYYEGVIPPEGGESTSGGGTSGGVPGGSNGGAGTAPTGAIGAGTPVKAKPDTPKIHTEPGGRSNNAMPVVSGNASGAGAVSLFTNANCSGTPIVKGTPAQLSEGFAVPVAPNATTEFSAMAFGSQHSTCSSPVAYTEDSLAPRTRITMGPGVKTLKRKVVFRFQDVTEDPPGTSFVCKVDKKKWRACASPFKVKQLKPGHHVLAIRATDLAGNVEPKPVKRKFIVATSSSS